MGKLQGKVAVITGATAGIGLAAAELFVKEGAHVFITGRRQKELDAAVRAIGHGVTGVQGDVANLSDLDRLYETVQATGRRIDIVFANAGFGEFRALGEITEEHFDKLFDINVKGTLFTVQKALPLLNAGASIILTGSVASIKGTPAFWVYGATKAAIRNFVRTLAIGVDFPNVLGYLFRLTNLLDVLYFLAFLYALENSSRFLPPLPPLLHLPAS